MPGRKREPSFQLASGTTDERDGSYNLLNTLGSIFYNTDTSNVEIRHEDPSNTLEWRDLVMNNKEQIDISGKLVVDGDVSFNAHISAMDASFHKDVTVVGNLYVDGSFNFGEVIKNITTVNNELLISTQVDISNYGTGPALKVSQYGDGADDKLAVFDAGEQGVAFEIMYDGDSVFHKDVSFQKDVGISGSLVVDGDVSFNAHLSVLDASFQNDVDIGGKLVVNGAGVSSTNVDIGGTTITNSGSAILLLQSPNNNNCFIKSCAGPNFTAGQHEIEFHHYVAGRGWDNTIKFKLHNGTSTATPQDVLTLIGNGNATVTGTVTSNGVDIGGTTLTNSGDHAILKLQSPDNGACFIKSCAGPGWTAGQHEIEFYHYVGSNAQSNKMIFRLHNGSSTATPQDVLTLNGHGNATVTGSVTSSDGNPLTSDDRIKENEKLIVNATETLSKLTPQIYDKYRTMDLSGSSIIESGLIAQEVYYNAPELRHLVHLGKDTDASGNEYTPTPEEMDLSGVDIANDPDYGSHGWSKTEKSAFNYSGLIAYLIKSNQELVERIEILKTENTELKTDISFIKTENTEQKGEIIQLTTDISLIRNHIGI